MEKTCARIVCIEDIENSRNISKNFSKQFCSPKGVILEEVNIIARVNGFSEENNKYYVILKDETGEVPVRLSEQNQTFGIENNDLLLIIGFLNIDKQKKYINPYLIKKIQENEEKTEKLRKLQIINFYNYIDKNSDIYKTNKEIYDKYENIKDETNKLEEKQDEPMQKSSSVLNPDNLNLKENLIHIIKKIDVNNNGVSYVDILDKFEKEQKEEAETIIDSLLDEGICYEPIAGRIKILE
ncbi:MAG: hypothetical protein B6U87_02865 [Candidatus Aenigmarchaeota archaeon ex4484_52]|nr:MAG: hypothetical protein B6U87_02865 [Candidatus Aenigmarchaeota archaeon ex4484_52]